MSEPKLISPLLDGMEIVSCIHSGGGTSVYLLRSTITGQSYVLKHISVPESQTQVDALLFTGAAADEAAAQSYFEQLIEDFKAELDDLELLQSSTNFANYLNYQICRKEDGIGFEIYLLSERWKTLVEYLNENAMTHLKALNLGLDLCTALCDLRARGLIHRDIKPENIYLNGLNSFMLGDLGVARIDNLKYCAMPERMVTEYTAPEMTDILSSFNTTIDIYSVGMVLYRILNGNHGPFEDEKTSPKAANKRRISGEALPAPLYSDYELTEIILKACAFEPTDRYQTPEELMQDLVLYMKRNSVTDSLIVPPIITDAEATLPPELLEEEIEPVRFANIDEMDEQFVSSFSPDTQGRGSDDVEADTPIAVPDQATGSSPPEDGPAFAAPQVSAMRERDEDIPTPTPPAKKKPRRRRIWIPVVLAVVLAAAIGVSLYFLVFGGPPLHIASVELTDRGPDYLTVTVNAGDTASDLQLRCVDAYGNVQTAAYTGDAVTFSNLSAGAQYTITVLSSTNKRVTGNTSAMFTTIATTEIVSFTATSPIAGQADLQFAISGPSPDEWTIRYSADGVSPEEVTFTGNSITIFDLETSLTYTFELLAPDGLELTGETTLEFSTGPVIEIRDLAAASLSEDAVVVTWSTGEAVPEEWSVTCTGTDGSILTKTVNTCEAEFDDLISGETYTITVTSSGTTDPATITVTPTAATVTAMEANVQEDGSILVSWSSDNDNMAWQLFSTVVDTELTSVLDVSGTQATLTGLIPGETYTLELRSGTGEKLGGSATTEVAVPEAESFDAYGASRFFMGMFLRPDKENWTANDLTTMESPVFSLDQRIVFAVQSLTGRTSSDDPVEILYVVEDALGKPVQAGVSSATWDSLWTGDLYLGELSDPISETGSYTLRLYFNSQFVASKEFEITD